MSDEFVASIFREFKIEARNGVALRLVFGRLSVRISVETPVILVFFSSSMGNYEIVSPLSHHSFLPYPFQFICHMSIFREFKMEARNGVALRLVFGR
jgi:hypothetical protein